MSRVEATPQSTPRKRYRVIPKYDAGGFFGLLHTFSHNPLDLMERAHKACGPLVRLPVPLPGVNVFAVSDPELIQRVLVEDERNFRSHPVPLKKARLAAGIGLFTLSGPQWKEMRDRHQPAFSRERTNGYAPAIIDATKRMLDGWPQHGCGEVDVAREMSLVTLRVTLASLFSTEYEGDVEAIFRAFHAVQRRIAELNGRVIPVPRWIPTKNNREFRKIESLLDEVARQMLGTRREMRDDLFSRILQGTRGNDANRCFFTQLRGEIITTMFVGHDTSSTNLTYALQLLIRHPDVLRKLEWEIAAMLRGRIPGAADLPTLEFSSSVLNESLRLFPPGWMQQRRTLHAIEHKGYKIPRKSIMLLSTWYVHRDPAIWHDPLSFRPERFSKGSSGGRHRFSFFPFGGGPKKCIGFHLAHVETLLILVMIIQRYELIAVERIATPSAGLTLRPESGINLTVKIRDKVLGSEPDHI